MKLEKFQSEKLDLAQTSMIYAGVANDFTSTGAVDTASSTNDPDGNGKDCDAGGCDKEISPEAGISA